MLPLHHIPECGRRFIAGDLVGLFVCLVELFGEINCPIVINRVQVEIVWCGCRSELTFVVNGKNHGDAIGQVDFVGGIPKFDCDERLCVRVNAVIIEFVTADGVFRLVNLESFDLERIVAEIDLVVHDVLANVIFDECFCFHCCEF